MPGWTERLDDVRKAYWSCTRGALTVLYCPAVGPRCLLWRWFTDVMSVWSLPADLSNYLFICCSVDYIPLVAAGGYWVIQYRLVRGRRWAVWGVRCGWLVGLVRLARWTCLCRSDWLGLESEGAGGEFCLVCYRLHVAEAACLMHAHPLLSCIVTAHCIALHMATLIVLRVQYSLLACVSMVTPIYTRSPAIQNSLNIGQCWWFAR